MIRPTYIYFKVSKQESKGFQGVHGTFTDSWKWESIRQGIKIIRNKVSKAKINNEISSSV